MKIHEWIQIPVAPMYEINNRGQIRNIKSGRFVKPWTPKDRIDDKQFALCIVTGGKPKNFHQSSLLWLTHGIIPKRQTHSRICVPVIVSHGNEKYYFDSCRQAGAFIARREKKHTAGYIAARLSRRPKEFDGWRINYQR